MRERKDGRGQEADRDRAQVQRASLGLSPLYLYLEVSTTSVPSHMQAAVAPTVRGHACCSKLVRTTHTTLRRASDRQMGNKSTRERQWETKRRVNDSWRLFAPELQLVETLHCATMSAVGPKP
jgi:hypothetical protein